MRKILLILFAFFISCNSKVEVERNNSDYAMYGLLSERFYYSSEKIQQEIYDTVNEFELSENQNAKKYDSLTHDYKLYLDGLNQKIADIVSIDSQTEYKEELSNRSIINELFFNENGYSKIGDEYLNKKDNYRTEVLKLVQNKNLAIRISQTLKTKKETVRYGKELEHLNFYFRDMPPISIIFYINYTKYSILEFENEFMKDLALKNR